MPLVLPEAPHSRTTLREVVGIAKGSVLEMQAKLLSPGVPVYEPGPIMTALQLAEDILSLEPVDLELVDEDELRRLANIYYSTSLVLLEYLKTYTATPKVPRRRT